MLVVLENHELNEVIGVAESPTFDRLSKLGALAVNYYARSPTPRFPTTSP